MSEQSNIENSQKLHLTNQQIFDNFHVLSQLCRSIVKTHSDTDYEFDQKFEVDMTVKNAYHRWGRAGQGIPLGLLTYYCLKGKSPVKKVGLTMTYVYICNHFYTIGSYIGIYYNLNSSIEQLNMGNQYKTGIHMHKLLERIIKRDEDSSKGLPRQTDRKFQEAFYSEVIQDQKKDSFDQSFIANDYFSKNYEKYMKKEGSDEAHRIFEPLSDDYQEERLKLPYFDNFATRYVYHSFTRWVIKVGKYIGAVEDR